MQIPHYEDHAQDVAFQHGFICFHQERKVKDEIVVLSEKIQDAARAFDGVPPSILRALEMNEMKGLLQSITRNLEIIVATLSVGGISIKYVPEQYRDNPILKEAWEAGYESGRSDTL